MDNEFDRLAASERHQNIGREFWHFLKQTRKWWLLPILVVVFALGVLTLLSGSAVAPFIYTLF